MQRPGCSQHAADARYNRNVPRWLKSPLLGAFPKGPTRHLRSAAQPAGASASPEPHPSATSSKRASTTRSTGAVLSQLLPPPEARELLASTWGLLRSSFWPVLLIYAMKDAVAFLLHRLGHRLTNLIAEATLGIPLSSITNPWWLHLDSRFLDGNIGYQVVIGFVFLVCLPLNILLNSYALATTMQVVKARTGEAAAAAQAPPSPSASGRTATSADSQAEASTSNRSSGQAASTASGPADPSSLTPSSALGGSAVAPASQRAIAPPSATPSTVAPPTASTSTTPSPTAGTSGSDKAGPGAERPAASDNSHQGTTWFERAASVLGLRSAPESESAPASSPKEESGAATGPGSAAGPAVVTLSSVDSQSSLDAEIAVQSQQKPGMWQQLRAAWSDVWAAVPLVHAMLWRVWVADLRFNLQAMPLQGLSLLVLPMPWTLPRLLSIQVTVPSAIAEGVDGAAAMQRSSELMQGFRRAYAWPFTALILSIRLLDMARTLLLTLVPPRWWQEIVELPVALIVAFGFTKIVIIRLQDIMPAAAYLSLVSPSRPATPQGSESGGEEGEEQQPLLSQAPSL